MKPVGYLNPTKGNAVKLLEAFAAGCGGTVTTEMKLQPGPAVFYGVEPVTHPVYAEVVRLGLPHYYIDNGYFCSKWNGGAYYRVTFNRPQHDGIGESNGKRLADLGIKFERWAFDPWAEKESSNRHILLALQSDYWYERHGFASGAVFSEKVQEELKGHTARKVIVRGKPLAGHKEPPLDDQLRTAWAVVTHSSNVAVDGLIRGIPAFCLHPCAALTLGSDDLSRIEAPVQARGRKHWAEVLADNQWSVDEIRAGVCWKAIGR